MTGVEMLRFCARRCRDSITLIEEKMRRGEMMPMEASDHLMLLRQQVAIYEEHADILAAALTNKAFTDMERPTNARTN
jgi:hypothetical protein